MEPERSTWPQALQEPEPVPVPVPVREPQASELEPVRERERERELRPVRLRGLQQASEARNRRKGLPLQVGE
jgi:hypothetical protein